MGFRWLGIIWRNKLKASLFALAWVLVSYVLRLPFRLAEDAIFDWLNKRISEVWVILMSVFVEWVIPILLAMGVVWLVYWLARRERKSPQLQTEVEGTAASGSSLDFSVKIESIEYRYGAIFLDLDLDTRKRPPPWLVAQISFRTNQTIQIASLHLEIDPIDPRDIIEPDSNSVQGFPLPHILHRAETHRFQFQLSPRNTEGEHKLFLKVLASGQWYTVR